MAKASWNTLNKTSGTGNGSFTSGGSVHTGRLTRTSTVTVAATGVTGIQVTNTQLSPGNILTVDTPTTVIKTGGTLTLGFESNTSKLTVSVTGTGFTLSSLQISTDGGSTWKAISSGTAISGDPGASAKYLGRIGLTVTANPTISSRTATVKITPLEGTEVTKTVSQAAGDPTLSVSPVTITVPANGTAQTVNINSNTSWNLS